MESSIRKQSQTDSNPVIMASGKNLKCLHGCKTAYYYSKLSLHRDGFESSDFLRNAIWKLASNLQNGSLNCNMEMEEYFKHGFLREWFGTDAEWESEYNKNLCKVLRLADYITNNNYTVKEIRHPFEAEFNGKPFLYKGYDLAGIRDCHDLVLERDGKLTLVSLFMGKPEYSMRARKAERKPENSFELLVSLIGGYITFEQEFCSELWYVTNNDDSGSNMPSFEHRTGKNIITSKILDEMARGDVFRHFLSLLNSDECTDCSSCFYSDVCKKPVLREMTSPDEKVSKKKEQKFTDAQKEVIEHVNGPMCCIAVPGAGKTTALVQRMIRLVEKGVRPDKILMLTFTKKAANEIAERVDTLLNNKKLQPVISTYNALGFSILKENPLYVGGKRLKLADDVDRYKLIYNAISQSPTISGVSYSYIAGEHGLIRILDKFFHEIEEYGEEKFISRYRDIKDVDGILKVYDAYHKEYKKKGLISFDEQISMVNELFEDYDELLNRCSEKYDYIMVDEFQDTSEEQAEMIYALARRHSNLLVVGDDDQSIYKWRGGSPSYMLNFKDDFPNAKIVYMEDNFRSKAPILKLADALIQDSGERYEKQLHSHIDGGEKPIYIKGVPTDIVDIIKTTIDSGVAPGDISVLARNNKQLREVQMLLEGKYPVAVPKDYMIEDAGFIVIYDMLTLFFKGLDQDVAFYRIMSYLGAEKFISNKQSKESLYQAMVRDKKLLPIENTAECVDAYYKHSKENACMSAGYKILKCFEKISYSNLRDVISNIMLEVFGVSEHRLIDAICDKAEERGMTKIADLYYLMGDMAKYKVEARVGYDVSTSAINLLTCHDSKGKEFHTVIVYGMEEFEEDSDVQESIRVLYVAMTRAEHSLYLLENAKSRETGIFNKISPYVQVVGGRR